MYWYFNAVWVTDIVVSDVLIAFLWLSHVLVCLNWDCVCGVFIGLFSRLSSGKTVLGICDLSDKS